MVTRQKMRRHSQPAKMRRPGDARAFARWDYGLGQDVAGKTWQARLGRQDETTTSERCAFIRRHRLIVAAAGGLEKLLRRRFCYHASKGVTRI